MLHLFTATAQPILFRPGALTGALSALGSPDPAVPNFALGSGSFLPLCTSVLVFLFVFSQIFILLLIVLQSFVISLNVSLFWIRTLSSTGHLNPVLSVSCFSAVLSCSCSGQSISTCCGPSMCPGQLLYSSESHLLCSNRYPLNAPCPVISWTAS